MALVMNAADDLIFTTTSNVEKNKTNITCHDKSHRNDATAICHVKNVNFILLFGKTLLVLTLTRIIDFNRNGLAPTTIYDILKSSILS